MKPEIGHTPLSVSLLLLLNIKLQISNIVLKVCPDGGQTKFYINKTVKI